MLHVPTGLEHTPLFLSVKKQAASARSGHGLNGSQSPHPNAAKQEEVGIGLFPRSQDGAPPGRHHLSELLSNQKRLPLGDWPIPAFDLSRPNSQRGCPALCAFRGWEPMRPASRRFSIGLRYTGRPRTKSKSQAVESIVSHRLKIRRGRASLPSKEGPNIHVDY